MNRRKFTYSVLALAFVSFSSLAEVAVIVSAKSAQNLTEVEIKNLFTGKQKGFSDGSPAIVLNLVEGDPKQSEFNQKALGRSDAQLKAFWSKSMFTGKGNPPKEVTPAEMLTLVAENPSTVGVVDLSMVNDSVRVIKKY